jgi:hypothetical protein
MNTVQTLPPRFWLRPWHVVVLVLVGLPALCWYGITGFFRLGSETKTLQASVMGSSAGHWEKQFAVRVGFFSMSAVRWGSHFFDLPPEARAALNAVRSGEVGIYKLPENEQAFRDTSVIFPAADKAMKAGGWERVVGVVQGNQLVGVYVPRKGVSPQNVGCCVCVLQERDLVVVSARGNLDPVLALARKHLEDVRGG